MEVCVERGQGGANDRDVCFDGGGDPGGEGVPGNVVGGGGVDLGVVEDFVGEVYAEGAGCADTIALYELASQNLISATSRVSV